MQNEKEPALTKENFWNGLYEKYPKGVQVFCDWIDQYKKENNWHGLFNGNIPIHDNGYPASDTVARTIAPKFHDLPRAMQIGIWIEFVCDRGGCTYEIEDLFTYDWNEDITQMCRMLHEDDLQNGK